MRLMMNTAAAERELLGYWQKSANGSTIQKIVLLAFSAGLARDARAVSQS